MKSLWRGLAAIGLLMVLGCSESNPTVPADQLPVDHLPAQLMPLSYNIELYLQSRKDEFTGHVEIDVDVKQPFDRLWLHGAQLKVGTVQIVGATIATGEWRQHTPEGLASIYFDRTVPAGRSKIILDYSAPYSQGLKGFIRARDKSAYLASMGDGGARYVVPGFDEPRYRAPIELSIDMPSQLAALASTAVANHTDLENQRRVVRFRSSPPMALGSLGWVVAELSEPEQLTTNNSVVSGYGVNTAMWQQGLTAMELRSEHPYPFQKLDVLSLPALNDTVNAAGLIINPEATTAAQATRLAQHWFEHAGAYQSWQAQCVARGIAKWAGLDAYRNAQLLSSDYAQRVWQQVQQLDRYPLGAMCWDVPSDKVLPFDESEDLTLIAGALLSLEDKHGRDVLADKVWRDWLAHRDVSRGVQDFMPELYQRVYSVLQDGRMMPHRCQADCEYTSVELILTYTVEQALASPKSVPLQQWRSLSQAPDVIEIFERIASETTSQSIDDMQHRYGEAWIAAMADRMQRDFDHWSAFLRRASAESESESARMAALFALAESNDSRVSSWFQQLFLNRVLPPHQSDALFTRLMQSPQAEAQMRWLSSNRDKIMRKLTPAQRVHWLDALGALCSNDALALVKESMTQAAPLIYRGEARLQRALKSIEACIQANP